MTVSSVDTAELPRVRSWVAAAPVLDPPAPGQALSVPAPSVSTSGRAELRAERRYARRQRRLYALLGLSVLATMLAATVTVLDVIR
jgi:hypothetical protein